jgi:hypothetical protein
MCVYKGREGGRRAGEGIGCRLVEEIRACGRVKRKGKKRKEEEPGAGVECRVACTKQ